MAKTAVVNKKKKKGGGKKKRRNYGSATSNKRKKRRKNPSTAMAPRRRGTPRRRNPGIFDMDSLMDTVPAATGGVWLGRWGVKLAGEFEENAQGVREPGLKHAFAILIAANMGGDMLGNMLGSAAKGEYARIACLGFGGDMFLRKRFMRDSDFVNENLSLEGIGYDDDDEWDEGEGYDEDMEETYLEGLHQTSALGQGGGEMVVGPDGQLYQVQQQPGVSGFSTTSSLGMAPARPSSTSSFGYA